MQLIKRTIKVGNSAGVLLPKQYLNSQVKITLEPLNIERDVIDILIKKKLLKEVIGVYLVGSYARGEQTIESDVDILVITTHTDKTINKEPYDLTCVSKKELERQLKQNALPMIPMIKEAKPIINKELIKQYIHSPLTKKNLKWHLDTTLSVIQFIEEDQKIASKLKETKTSDRIAYSLILRLRTMHIIDRLRKNKSYTKKEFLKFVRKISGSLEAYQGYVRSKSKKKSKKTLPINEAKKIVQYLKKEVTSIRKWLKEKKG